MSKCIEFYVSVCGADSNDGSKNSPFATPEKAVCEVRKVIANGLNMPVTVYFHAGNYKVDGLELTAADSGTEKFPVKYCAYGDGEVVFNGGETVAISKFSKVTGSMLDRLAAEAKDHVLVYDLKTLDIPEEILKPLYTPNHNREDFRRGRAIEVFCDDRRLDVARYPNGKDFLKIEDVKSLGDVHVHSNDPDVFTGPSIFVDKATNERIKNWKEPQKAWAQGYFGVDWADTADRIKSVDTAEGVISLAYPVTYGANKGEKFYLYNAPEEIDVPGEYYFDRDDLLLYVYPFNDSSDIIISVSDKPILACDSTSNIIFEDITFKNSKKDAIVMDNAHNCVIKNCKVLNVLWAMHISGENNTVYGCDISHTAQGGISLSGGNSRKLEHANNVAENNYVHDWSDVFYTYGAGIEICGCGNKAAHNELARTTHMGIYYSGTDELIEYNYLHEVVQQAHDAGAVYGGRDWAAYGCVIRYNIIENVGNEEYNPCGIYWDDAQSGQTAYGNILINVKENAFLVGGGRDNVATNNMMINSHYTIHYDQRERDNAKHNGLEKKGHMWATLKGVPVNEEPWISRFPTLARVHEDLTKIDDPNLAVNPSRAVFKNNICVSTWDDTFLISEYALEHGTFENNLLFTDVSECLVEGSYELKPEVKKALPEFKDIPVNEIGLYKD